ncbi:helix-turn-helix transcriptional regulator [Virgibacillus dakarensis]|nr:helix-turn-helix transcriptional regulator [Virgibacillus dakarensis]MBT2215952.1 helix-turn-helix transcriptional regulator [Virgibacillus dakarensis]
MKQWVLKRLRDEANLTQKEFAEKIGMTPYSYNRKENGKTAFADYEMFKIRNFFDKPIDDIFLDSDCNEVAIKEAK